MSRRFPEDFLFGAATAAYQIEGAATRDGRGPSIWDTFCRVPGAVLGGDTGDVACEHYDRYRDDVRLMRELGLQTYRFSVSWARVAPDGVTPNPAGLDFYRRLVDELTEAGIRPWLTLYHWDLPQALEDRGGWVARDTASRFADYAMQVHDALGDRVPVWTTLNEPWCSAFLGYLSGAHAPGRQDAADAVVASHHLLLAHGWATQRLRAADASADLGITLNQTVADPRDPADPADLDAARRIDGQFNRWFLDPLFRGEYPADIRETIGGARLDAAIRDGDLAAIATPFDTLGVNYYHGDLVSAQPPDVAPPDGGAPTERPTGSPYPDDRGIHVHDRGLPRTGMGWEVQPEALTRTLRRLYDEYTAAAGVRLVVTENGSAYPDVVDPVSGTIDDVGRASFLLDHLAAVLDAIDAGVPVGGYFAWSLLDNFEWAWGHDQRFGIVHVDYATQRRTVKRSGREYARVVASRAL
jgi:beta-glucosidase